MRSFVAFIALLAVPAGFLSGCGTTSPNSQARPQAKSIDKPETKIATGDAPVPAQPQPTQLQPQPERDGAAIVVPPAKVKAEDPKRTARGDEKSAPVEKPMPEEALPTALQEAPGPAADDRLVDLLQKEIDHVMEQPPGRRKIQFSMSLVENDHVRYFCNYFSGRLKGWFERALARSGRYIPMMAATLQEAGLPEDLVYLSLIESGFSTAAISKAKAVGPWQFIRATGLRYGLRIDSWVDERRDPVKSTRAAAAYLKDLHEQFGEWFLAAAAYNAGERKVEKAIQKSQTNDFWLLSQQTTLKQETRNYVPKFIAAALIAGAPERFGFGDLDYEAPLEYEEVFTRRPLSLTTVAVLAGTTSAKIKELNPALLRNMTPPSETGFSLRVPAGAGETFTQAYAARFDSTGVKVITHTVKKGETLASIAKRYQQRASQITEVNELKTPQLRIGQQLLIVQDGRPEAPSRQAAQGRSSATAKKSKTSKTR
jgi:membrane-bound lytic murein transglycosylase D